MCVLCTGWDQEIQQPAPLSYDVDFTNFAMSLLSTVLLFPPSFHLPPAHPSPAFLLPIPASLQPIFHLPSASSLLPLLRLLPPLILSTFSFPFRTFPLHPSIHRCSLSSLLLHLLYSFPTKSSFLPLPLQHFSTSFLFSFSSPFLPNLLCFLFLRYSPLPPVFIPSFCLQPLFNLYFFVLFV